MIWEGFLIFVGVRFFELLMFYLDVCLFFFSFMVYVISIDFFVFDYIWVDIIKDSIRYIGIYNNNFFCIFIEFREVYCIYKSILYMLFRI